MKETETIDAAICYQLCNGANPCEAGFCVAPYADNNRGEFTCVADCVAPGDEASWCFDAAACCDPEATCTERGYCVVPGDTDGTSSGGSESTGSSSTG